MSKPLTESVLRRLTSEAWVTYLGQADQLEGTLRPGCCSVTTGEPVADLNYIVAGPGATENGALAAACTTFIARNLPFLAILFPEAGSEVEQTAAELGLVHVVDFPFMVRDDAPIEPEANDRRGRTRLATWACDLGDASQATVTGCSPLTRPGGREHGPGGVESRSGPLAVAQQAVAQRPYSSRTALEIIRR